MKKTYIFLFIAAIIITYSQIHTMMSRTSQIAKQKAWRTRIQQPQRRLIQTKQPIQSTSPTTQIQSTGLSSYWTALKNKIVGVRTTTIPTVPVITKTVAAQTIPSIPIVSPIIPNIFARIDVINTLPETEKELINLTQTELNTIKTETNSPEQLWTDLIEKMHESIHYIQENCFTHAHPNAQWDTDIPEELNKKIILFLNNENINLESISVHYRDTTLIDPFDHDTISVTGPTLLYQSDMQTGTKNI